MKRAYYLICYDIPDEARLRRVRDFLATHRIPGQKSVAECWLSAGELVRVKTGLIRRVDRQADRVLMARIDPDRGLMRHGRRDAFDPGTGSFFLT